ncbi:MAG: protein kinase [Archangiaceae bacterium]|nr:protein kinase [Archangiaceae bacterium]
MTTVLGRYELQRRLGAGGMAEVWLARASGPSGFEKQVVVKRILPQLAGDSTVEELFKTEARLAARLDHPNLLQVFDFGREGDGALVLVMELIDGTSLRQLVRAVRSGKQLEARLAAKLMALVCEGLHSAHELKNEHGQPLNLVHRDISPENILLARSGAVKVADFGIARIEREVQLTAADTFRGKIGYAAPEQLLGEPVTRHADIWAVGVTLFELMTGEQPFVTETSAELAAATVHREPRRLDAVRPGAPLGLVEIISRCLAREPGKRFATAHALSEQLEDFVAWSGTPVRSSDLGALISGLGIEPHTVSSSGTPSGTVVPPLHSIVDPLTNEPSTFQPMAELSADGKLHAIDVAAPAPAPLDRGKEFTFSGEPVSTPGESQQAREHRFGALELEPIAVVVERPGDVPPAPQPRPFPFPTLAMALAGVALLALVGFGVTRLKLPDKSAPAGALFIDSTPSGAAVLVGGEQVGETPWAGDNAPGGVTTIVLKRPGFVDTTLRIDGGLDWSGTVKLTRGATR